MTEGSNDPVGGRPPDLARSGSEAASSEAIGRVGRRVVIGALIGAIVGLLIGLLLHAIFGSGSTIVGYEIVGGLGGVIVGALLGGFYGGAMSLPRDRPSR